jgi:hypothetical protein
MNGESTPPQQSRGRLVLPGGRAIEVLLFGEPAPRSASPGVTRGAGRLDTPSSTDEERLLHLCPACASHLVYPTEWSEQGERHWSIDLRCPECEWTDTGVFSQGIADAFDEELDLGVEALVRDLRSLANANMADEIERFAFALGADAILPSDF